jgi:Transposase DDE domain
VESGLIVHHDVRNDANNSHLLHPMSVAAKKVLEIDELHVLTDGGYSNAVEVARCEDEAIIVSAPIKRGAMNSEHFRPTQFHYDEASDTIRCPAGQTLRPSGKHTRNRAIRYRTSACKECWLKAQCTPGAQRTIHRLSDQGALDQMERRIYADPSLMRIRRCTVEHPFRHDQTNVGRRQVSDARAKEGKGRSGAVGPRLQHPPRRERLRGGEAHRGRLIRPC